MFFKGIGLINSPFYPNCISRMNAMCKISFWQEVKVHLTSCGSSDSLAVDKEANISSHHTSHLRSKGWQLLMRGGGERQMLTIGVRG